MAPTGPEPLAPGRGGRVPVSPTLAASEALAARRDRGLPVLPLGFGEVGLPVLPELRELLAAAAGRNAYGPVAGLPELRAAAAGYWDRRGLPTSPQDVVCGPGSKALLFGLLMAVGADVAIPSPSWVSYAAQARLSGARAHLVAVPPGEGGGCDPGLLRQAVTAARAQGRRIGAVVVTMPDNPTGRTASAATVRGLAEVAAEFDLVIICDEIYSDLRYDPAPPDGSPARRAAERTVITTGLSKSLALGGWRIGAARLPPGPLGRALRDQLLGIGSEIWSAPAGPVQQAAAWAFTDPPAVTGRIGASRRLHAAVARAAAARLTAAGLAVPPPQAAFYLYPDFEPWREHLRERAGLRTGAQLAGHLLDGYGMGALPASAFGEDERALRLRLATGLLYGDTDDQREQALAAADPVALPWIAAALDRLSEVLAALGPAG